MARSENRDMGGAGRGLYKAEVTLNLYSFLDVVTQEAELDDGTIELLAEAYQEWILTTQPQLNDDEERYLELIIKASEFYLINIERIHLLNAQGGFKDWASNPVRQQTEFAHCKMFQPAYKKLYQLNGVLNVSGWAAAFVVDATLRAIDIANKKAFQAAMLNPESLERMTVVMDFMCDLLQHMDAKYQATK